jgi:hypothetical protein
LLAALNRMREAHPPLAAFLAEPWSREHTPVVYDTLLLIWLAVEDSQLWEARFHQHVVAAIFDVDDHRAAAAASAGGGGDEKYFYSKFRSTYSVHEIPAQFIYCPICDGRQIEHGYPLCRSG